jgi:hypothetical protein
MKADQDFTDSIYCRLKEDFVRKPALTVEASISYTAMPLLLAVSLEMNCFEITGGDMMRSPHRKVWIERRNRWDCQ